MSRGPGRIERAIRQLFDVHPDEAFTLHNLCNACYPGDFDIERKHQVAVLRAAAHVVACDPDWQSLPSPGDRRALIFCNRASVPSMIMRHHLRWASRARAVERTRELLAHPDPVPWQRKQRDDAVRGVSQHLAIRDADPAEAERLTIEREAESAARLAGIGRAIRALGGRPQVLPTAHSSGSATLTALADKVRALITQNDPDAVRAGLREIADVLDRLGGREAPTLAEAAD